MTAASHYDVIIIGTGAGGGTLAHKLAPTGKKDGAPLHPHTNYYVGGNTKGHNLEIIYFPPGKGDPRWQNKERLFLGIDHTAIVVSDTERSLKFYRDVLGMKLAGESENYGIEQERLNNVFGARLRISGMRTKAGPGVEFLDYLAPRDGRPAPADSRANDLWHWQTAMGIASADGAAQKIKAARARLVSSGAVTIPQGALGFDKGLLARDPDGHALQLVEK